MLLDFLAYISDLKHLNSACERDGVPRGPSSYPQTYFHDPGRAVRKWVSRLSPGGQFDGERYFSLSAFPWEWEAVLGRVALCSPCLYSVPPGRRESMASLNNSTDPALVHTECTPSQVTVDLFQNILTKPVNKTCTRCRLVLCLGGHLRSLCSVTHPHSTVVGSQRLRGAGDTLLPAASMHWAGPPSLPPPPAKF